MAVEFDGPDHFVAQPWGGRILDGPSRWAGLHGGAGVVCALGACMYSVVVRLWAHVVMRTGSSVLGWWLSVRCLRVVPGVHVRAHMQAVDPACVVGLLLLGQLAVRWWCCELGGLGHA